MKHTLLITACLLGLTGFSGIASSPASAQTSETSTVVTAPSENAVSRNDHTLSFTHASEFANVLTHAPLASKRPKARGAAGQDQVMAHHISSAPKRAPKEVLNSPAKPRAVFIPRPVAKQVKRPNPWGARRASPAVQINHGVFR